MMKKQLLFIAMCMVIFSCEKEEVTKAPFEPYIYETNMPSRILPHGATLSARFNNNPEYPLAEVGFILSEGEINSIGDGQKLLIADSTRERLSKGHVRGFVYHVTGLKKSQQYNVRVFASTNESSVLGEQLTFTTPGANEWIKLDEFDENPFRISYPANAILVNGKLYIAKNANEISGDEIKREFDEYDPTTGELLSTPDFPGLRRTTARFSIGNKIFIGPGADNANKDSTYRRTVWAFDVVTRSWTELSAYPGPEAYSFSAFTIGNKAYLFARTPVVCFWEYDIDQDTWRELNVECKETEETQASIKRALMAVGIDGKGYFVFNRGPIVKAHDVWSYDPVNDKWNRLNDLIIEDFESGFFHPAISFNISVGGCFFNDADRNLYQYYSKSDSWSISPVTGFSVKHSALVEDAIYAFSQNSVHVMALE